MTAVFQMAMEKNMCLAESFFSISFSMDNYRLKDKDETILVLFSASNEGLETN